MSKFFSLFISLLFPALLICNPSGEKVIHGECAFERGAQLLKVHQQSEQAIVHWENFSIQTNETTHIFQPSETSSVLNRVVSNNPSEIHGSLESNGSVFLLNQNGILIGPGGRVQTNGFVASALEITDAEFLGGKEITFSGDSFAGVVNQGVIESFQGDVFLIARQAFNEGTLIAKEGAAGLGAAAEVLLVPQEHRRFAIRVPGEGSFSHTGLIEAVQAELMASGGDAHALAINMGGSIELVPSDVRDGEIYLETLEGTARVAGSMSAPDGGKIQLLGEEVRLEKTAFLDASGEIGGGTILIGGDFQGKNPEIPNAAFTHISPGAVVKADAALEGDGGTIVFWGDELCYFGAEASAKGGGNIGDGGLIEVSSLHDLQFKGKVDTKAAAGKPGTLLLDPVNTDIVNSAGPSTPGFPTSINSPPPTYYYVPSVNAMLADDEIQAALVAGNNVTIATSGGGAGAGTVNINPGVTITWGTPTTLTIHADHDLNVNPGATFTSTNNTDTFTAIDFTAAGNTAGNYTGLSFLGTIDSANGDVRLTGTGGNSGSSNVGISLPLGTISTSGSGDIIITGTGGNGSGSNVGISSSSLMITASGTGNIELTGTGNGSGSSNQGINISTGTISGAGNIKCTGSGSDNGTSSNLGMTLVSGSIMNTGSGNIELTGTAGNGSTDGNQGINIITMTITSGTGNIQCTGFGGNGTDLNLGLSLSGSTTITSGAGNIEFTGTGGNGSGDGNRGISMTSPSITSSGGTIKLMGTGETGGSSIQGIEFSSGSLTSSGAGNVELMGSAGNGSGDGNQGINFGSSAMIISSGAGDVELTGMGGTGTNQNLGISLSGSPTITSSGTGSVTLTGTAGSGTGNNNQGITISGSIQCQNAGNITLSGTGGNGTDHNRGISLDATPTIQNTGTGNIELTGSAGSGTADHNQGISVSGTITCAQGSLKLTGNGGTGTTFNYGINIDPTSSITGMGSGNIEIMGTGGNGTGANNGGFFLNGATVSCSGTGNLSFTGAAGNGTNENVGIRLINGTITSAAGDISLTGTGGGGTTLNRGILLEASPSITRMGAGNLSFTGTGGDGTGISSDGFLAQGGTISSSGTGTLTITGTPGTSTGSSNGIEFTVPFTLVTSGGDISLIAFGNNSATGSSNSGLLSTGMITANNNAKVNITASGSAGTANNHGVEILIPGTITVADGDLTVTGTTLVPGEDIRIENTVSASGMGNITLNGTATGSNIGIALLSISQIISTNGAITLTGSGAGGDIDSSTVNPLASSTSGNITLNADTLVLSGPSSTLSSSGTLTIAPRTATTTIGLGNAATGTLNLDATELSKIQDGFSSITIGSSAGTGAVNITGHTFNDPVTIRGGPMTLTTADLRTNAADDLSLFSSGAISISNPVLVVAGASGNLRIAPQFLNDTFGLGSAATGTTSIDDFGLSRLTGATLFFGRSLADLPNNVIDFNSTTTFSKPVSIYGRSVAINDSLTTSTGAVDIRIAAGANDGTFTLAQGQSLSAGTTISLIGQENSGNATFTFNEPGQTVNTLQGTLSGTNNTLNASNADNTWTLSGTDAGTLTDSASANIPFTRIQNLSGGSGNDTFNLANGTSFGGTLSGGAGGANILNLAAYTSAVTVHLGGGSSSFAGGLANFTSVLRPAGLNNTLIGPNTNWNITGVNTGTVNGIFFTNFPNLTGGSSNDIFVFASGGSITGFLDGGSSPGPNTLDVSAFAGFPIISYNQGTASGTATMIGQGFTRIQQIIPDPFMAVAAFFTQFDLSMLFLNESRDGVFPKFQVLHIGLISFEKIYRYYDKAVYRRPVRNWRRLPRSFQRGSR